MRELSPRRNWRTVTRGYLSAFVALLLISTLAVQFGHASPANAALGDAAGLTISKLVNTQAEITGVAPGETFRYDIVMGCDDNDCIDARLIDQLPDEFAGFTLSEIAILPAAAANFDLVLNGGCAPNAPLVAGCTIEVDFKQPLGTLAGVDQFGIIAGTTFRITYNLIAPLTLQPDWGHSGVAVPNLAEITALNATTRNSTARVTVDVPIVVNTAVTKTWTPNAQQYGPGSVSTVNTGLRNTSNVAANSLTLQDPSVAVDGAATLPNSNPFTRMDFGALCGVTMPDGADLVQVDVYYDDGLGTWNWVSGAPVATAVLPAAVTDASKIGGLRVTYTSATGDTIVSNGDAGSLCFTLSQRATHRTTGATLVTGGAVGNIAAGTVSVTGQKSVTRTASASLTVTGLTVVVGAGKQITPSRIPASGEFVVALSGKNDSNGTLTSLTISEPGSGVFLSDQLVFSGFTGHTWPTGATGASFVWHLNSGDLAAISLTSTSAVPGIPALTGTDFVTGFTVTYTGEIIPGTTAGWNFAVDTVANMIAKADVSESFTNTVGVSGTNAAGTAVDSATAPIEIYYPDIALVLNKTLNPALTTPGGTAVVELETVTSSESQYVRPTIVVIEDVWDGTAATSFWDAYRAQEIVFTDVPAGSTLHVQYATGTPPALVWHDLTVAPGVTALIDSLAVPDDALGLRFTYTDDSGFGQGTTFKPNIVFQASSTLRDGTTATAIAGQSPTRYDNHAAAQGAGVADSLVVRSDIVTDDDYIDMIVLDGTGTGPDVGSMLSSKRWVTGNWSTDLNLLNSQSGSSARTVLGWGVTTPGFDTVIISDAAAGSETTPGSTVYQAFNLTSIAPISFALDPLLRWDTVSSIELYRVDSDSGAGAWHTVTAPSGGWMNGTGFRGYTLTTTASAETTGVRITVVENTAARTASTDDPTRPAPSSGVASSAMERPMRLQWQLRNTLRVPFSPELKWVTQGIAYNVAGNGIVRNTFGLEATAGAITSERTVSDNISLIDTTPNVKTEKSVSVPWVTVPYFGDVALSEYPTVSFTIDAWNTANARASYLRSADPIPCATSTACVTPASDHSPDIFTGNAFDPITNPFERFTLTGITFATPSGTNIDRNASQVALWKRDSSGVLSVDQLSINAAVALTAAQLAEVIGVSVVYQSTDPATTGGLIPTQSDAATHPSMTLNTQLRATLRSNDLLPVTSGVTVGNTTIAQSFDPVLAPTGASSTPNASRTAGVELRAAGLDVTASKSITPDLIVETNPTAPITVTLGATSGSSTLGAQTATIRDIDAGFWAAFQITGITSVTMPAPGTRVRMDVQVNGDPTWIIGMPGAIATIPTAVTDLSEITGIQFAFDRADGAPFSDTVPSADWSADAVFTAVLRDGATFPGRVDNAIQTFATHDDYPVQDAAASDDVVLSSGTARIDVRKEALTGNTTHVTEPGVEVPWTLEFTNTGSGYLDITEVLDELGTHLEWDGLTPEFSTSVGGTLPTTGIEVTQPVAGQVLFTWPGEARMQPGEKFLITLNLSLLPGLTASQRATNEFTVSTAQTLTACTNVSDNGQGILSGLGSQECGTSNYVQPMSGALLFAQKSVKGEVDGTLVDGAVNVVNASLPCAADAQGFFRSNCAALTAVGATDTWRLIATNSGTVGYTSVTIVDVLPSLGDKLLATGASRDSGFRAVLKDVAGPGTANIPAGATARWEVSTDLDACIGAGAGSDWGTDPTCATTTWVLGATFTGDAEDITAVRWTVDFSDAPGGVLAPGGTVEVRFDTVNSPIMGTNPIGVSVPVGDQFAWNQFGVVATPTSGADIRRAPVKAGVVAQPAALQVSKVVEGAAASYAPENFEVTLSCTVSDGNGGRVDVDMGTSGALTVPANGSSTLAGIPLGAECLVDEETITGGATDVDLGDSVTLESADDPAVITVTNTFEGGPLNIIKNRIGVAALTHGAGPFTVEVACSWAPDDQRTPILLPDDGVIILSGANDYRAQLPVMPSGTDCEVVETHAGGATATTMDPVDGWIQIVQPSILFGAATVTITNVFDSSLLATSGVDASYAWSLAVLAFLVMLAGVLVLLLANRKRRSEPTRR